MDDIEARKKEILKRLNAKIKAARAFEDTESSSKGSLSSRRSLSAKKDALALKGPKSGEQYIKEMRGRISQNTKNPISKKSQIEEYSSVSSSKNSIASDNRIKLDGRVRDFLAQKRTVDSNVVYKKPWIGGSDHGKSSKADHARSSLSSISSTNKPKQTFSEINTGPLRLKSILKPQTRPVSKKSDISKTTSAATSRVTSATSRAISASSRVTSATSKVISATSRVTSATSRVTSATSRVTSAASRTTSATNSNISSKPESLPDSELSEVKTSQTSESPKSTRSKSFKWNMNPFSKKRALVKQPDPDTNQSTEKASKSVGIAPKAIEKPSKAVKKSAKPIETPIKSLNRTSKSEETSAAATEPPSRSVKTPAKSAKSTDKSTIKSAQAHSDPTKDSADISRCQYCARPFNSERLEKHELICVKTSQSRKKFDSSKKRIEGTEIATISRSKSAPNNSRKKSENPSKSSNWRKNHEEFIESLRQAKAISAHIAKGGKASDLPVIPAKNDGTPCPHCARKFGEASFARHVEICGKLKHFGPRKS